MVRRKVMRRLVVGAFLLWPWILPEQPWSYRAVQAAFMTLAVLSVVVLTGFIGQVSLAQAALMGVGAFSAARVSLHLGIDFPFNALVAGAAAALAAVMIGMAALRIRGLYLAIATLAFQWMMEASVLQWHAFSGGFNGLTVDPLKLGPYDFGSDRLFYYIAWPTAILAVLLVANLRDSKTGRAWFAIRGSEIAARTLGIDVTRYKLIGFAVSGFLVGVAGAVQLNQVGQATPISFTFQQSILYVAVAVLGGINVLAGAVVGGILFTLSDHIFQVIPALKGKIDIVAGALLVWTILQNPGGVVAAREHLKERIAAKRMRERVRAQGVTAYEEHQSIVLPDEPIQAEPLGARADEMVVSGGQSLDPRDHGQETGNGRTRADIAAQLAARLKTRPSMKGRREGTPILRAQEVTVRFGGVVANDEVSLEVRPGEICGLIGPNGAGKTTFFNSVNGLVIPDAGRVWLGGLDMTYAPVHVRATLGMGRTFQIMKLFPRLTVLENLMVATHLQNSSSFAQNLFMFDHSRVEDRRGRDEAREVLSFLGIAQYADAKVAGLPFGILRLVELGRALMTKPKLLLLDEPSSGLDVSETDAFAEILFRIRDDMGQTVLIIEHDMRLVMMISDYVYVLDFGRNLAEGLPKDIRANPAVVAAYLGEEAIA